MSVILHFPKQPQPRSSADSEDRGHSAQILFFTGVRIERHSDDDRQINRRQRGGSASGKRRRKA